MRIAHKLGCAVLAAVATGAFWPSGALGAVGLYQVTDGPGTPGAATTNIRGMAVDASGLFYVAGQAINANNALNAAYWTFNGSSVGPANIINANAGGSVPTQAFGIGVLQSGAVVVGGQITGGVGDWVSNWTGGDGSSNGWVVRPLTSDGGTQATVPGDANQIAVQAGGVRYYNLGRTTNGAFGYRYDAHSGLAGRPATEDRFALTAGGGAANASNRVQGVSVDGTTVGELRNTGGVRRGFVRNGGVTTLLPGSPTRTGEVAQPFAISADGLTATGLAQLTDVDLTNVPVYWTNSGGVWTFRKLARLPGSTSTGVGRGVSQTGKWIVGTDFVGNEHSVFWNTSNLDVDGNPIAVQTLPFLAGMGVDVSGWTRLGRTYSAYELPDGSVVIAGDGVTTDGRVRGFIAIVPEPATLGLLALGALFVRRPRR